MFICVANHRFCVNLLMDSSLTNELFPSRSTLGVIIVPVSNLFRLLLDQPLLISMSSGPCFGNLDTDAGMLMNFLETSMWCEALKW